MSATYTQVRFRVDFIVETTNINTDHKCSPESSLNWVHVLCIIGDQSISRRNADDKVVNSGKSVNI